MHDMQEYQLWRVRADARRNVGRLATRFARARSEEREAIMAEMAFERWLAEACEVCLDWPPWPEMSF
jgi:hypothetical protein